MISWKLSWDDLFGWSGIIWNIWQNGYKVLCSVAHYNKYQQFTSHLCLGAGVLGRGWWLCGILWPKCRNNISAQTINCKAKEVTNIPKSNLITNNGLKQGWRARGRALKARVSLKNDDPKLMLSHCSTRGHWTTTLEQLKNNTLFYSKHQNSPAATPKSRAQEETQRASALQLLLPPNLSSPGSPDTHPGSGELWDRAVPHPSPGTTVPKSSRDSSAWEHKDFIAPVGNITHMIKENPCQITSSQVLKPSMPALCDICGNCFFNFMTA